jgi:hypothetical protein
MILVLFFIEKMKIVTRIPFHKTISFWLCVGFFVYFSGNFFYLLFSSSTTDKEFINQMRTINSLVTFAKDIILALAWFAHERIETEDDIIKIHIPEGLGLDGDLYTKKPTKNN